MDSPYQLYHQLVAQTFATAASRHVVVLGDYTVDTYFDVDPEPAVSITSVETGLPVQIMHGSRFQPGGAGNVVANLVALGAGTVQPIGIVGDDEFAEILSRRLDARGVRSTGLIRDPAVQTAVYAKTIDHGHEVHRFDIGSVQRPSQQAVNAVISAFEAAFESADVVIVNQQLSDGWLSSQEVRSRVRQAISTGGLTVPVVVDSRDYAHEFSDCIRKLNQREAYLLVQQLSNAHDADARELPTDADWNPAHTTMLASTLVDAWQTPVVVTRGEHGAVVGEPSPNGDTATAAVEGVRVAGPVDPVGAGDSFIAGLALALQSSAGDSEANAMQIGGAARFATLAAAVTVAKQHETGTATPDEVHALLESLELIHAAESLYTHSCSEADTIEVIVRPRQRLFAAAVFDHDGTISTLREGWEAVMRRHMAAAIMGDPPRCPPDEQAAVTAEIDRYITESTGVQTIVQMTDLVAMVRRHGFMPESEILSPGEYKTAYTAELRRGVATRLEMLERGIRNVEDFTIRGAIGLLQRLRDRGIRIFLASGTDQDDVVAEAKALGYGELFERISGSVGNAERDPKRVVLEELMAELGQSGGVLVVGDGPVEMRVGRAHRATTVGVLSDEVRRYGWNMSKRSRQISAGAQLLVPDFTDADRLLELLFDPISEADHDR